MAIAAAAVLFCLTAAANAQNATWNGPGSDWNDSANWLPATIPTGVATFDTSSATTIFVFSNASVGEIRFPVTANSFNIYLDATLTINGVGIISNSANTQYFTVCNCGEINFSNSATIQSSVAQNIWLTNLNVVNFNDTSSAGNAFIDNQSAATLNFNNSASAASAQITNSGTLNFNNNATAANSQITNFNVLNFNGTSTAGTATIINNSSGTVTFDGTSSTVFSSAANATITNDGTINFNGYSNAGNANITNNYDLNFRDNSTAGNATITTTDNGITTFLDNSTGGNARFIVNGFGVLDFTQTLGPSGLNQITAGSFEGDGTIAIGNNTITVGSNNLSTEFSGEIADTCGCVATTPGNLIKIGTGTFTLSGYNTYTGFTEIRGGELHLTGTLSSNDVSVFNGATLSGDGAILGNLTINSGGIFRPGTIYNDQMSVYGNVTFNSSSRFQVTVNDSGGSTYLATSNFLGAGTVNIVGGTIEVNAMPGTYTAGTQYYIIQAGDAVTGTFTSITDNLAFYDFNAIYNPFEVILELVRNANTFNTFALTRNQIAVAGALDSADQSSALVALFSGFTPEQVRAALDLLSGEIYATMAGAFIDESRLFRNAIFSRLRNTGFAGFSGPLGYLADENSTLAYSAPAQAQQGPFNALRPANRGFEYWAQAFGSWAKYESDSNAAIARRNTGGFVFGLDKMLMDGVRAGLSAGYSNTQTRINDRASKAEGDTLHLAAYLSKLDGRWSYRAGAALAAHNVDSERNVLGENLRANYFALTGQIFGEVGYGMTAGQLALEPFANLALVHHYTGSFTETGGITAITTNGFNNTAAFSTLGMRMATRYNLASGQMLIPRMTVAWQHAFGDLAPTATLSFQSTGTGMTIAGTPLARDMLLTETGFDVRVSPFETLGFFYALTAASSSTEHALRGRYEWKF